MGYTHYWTLENGIEQSDWDKFLEGARLIIETAVDAGIPLEDNSEGASIYFNGVGSGAHETFVITSEDTGFNFCKTAQKPYDTVATAILIHLKQSLGSKVVVTSDGEWEDWSDGRLLYETVYDQKIEVDFLGV
jgi:hypothetical protein